MKVLIDANVVQSENLSKLEEIKKKLGSQIKFYLSNTLLGERLVPYYDHCRKRNLLFI